MEEAFWKCMVMRQVATVERRLGKPLASQVFKHSWLGLSCADWIQKYDWEEPLAFNSEWHQERVRLIVQVSTSALDAFCLTLVVFFFGSRAFVNSVQQHFRAFKSAQVDGGANMNLGWLYESAVLGCQGNPFHRRYNPNRLRANQWSKVASTGVAGFFQSAPCPEDPGSEDAPGSTAVAVSSDATRLLQAHLCLQGLPTVALAAKIFRELQRAKSEAQAWAALQKLPGMKGTGYNCKNLALLLRDTVSCCASLGSDISPGGPGPRQCYNLQHGRLRKARHVP